MAQQRPRGNDSRPTIPVPAEPGIPSRAPQCARDVAEALDIITGKKADPRTIATLVGHGP